MNELPRSLLPPHARSRDVTAVLGPTNTGKTHYAIERMLAHGTGIIGLPLRLLAREVYGRVVERMGAGAVALVTGEEKIKPERPRFWVCTVEAMPRDVDVDFVAIDEVQLAADLDRGHVFTDRLLHHRGRFETLLLGSGTMRGIVGQLLPGAHAVARPRLSKLTYAGQKKITRQPTRSAIVAFSATEVYEIAELIRRQRGGAAVVLGSLSPRTRNAQVALYQSGDVDFLVATDAIGMGLNLDVEHVAFASDRKFDGHRFRTLTPAEMGQIAGRAGRHLRDGTFGVTGAVQPLEPELVERLEDHEFEPVRLLQWRNTMLDSATLPRLRASLAEAPREPGLVRAPDADDVLVLDIAARSPEIAALAATRDDVERLWEAAQVPDYRKLSAAAHAELCLDVFRFLQTRGRLPRDWFARQVRHCDRLDGDIDTLSTRIAHMRTWSFIANRPDWLDDPDHWRETTRALEDKLSDALHERLTQRFVDRRTSVLMRRLRENAVMEAHINDAGDVTIADQPVGRLHGFQFTPEATAEAEHGRTLRAAASQALAAAIQARADRVSEAGNEQFLLASNGGLRWQGEEIARLAAGDGELEPRVRLLADDLLAGAQRERVQARLEAWVRHHVGTLLKPLFDLRSGAGLEGIAKGIAFRLVEDLGVLERAKVADDVKGLDQGSRSALRGLGVRFGAYHLFVPATMKPKPRELAAQLWALKHGGMSPETLQEVPRLAAAGRTSIPVSAELPRPIYRVAGYKVLGERAVRVDILERIADLIRPLVAFRPGVTPGVPPKGAAEGDGFTVTVEMTSLAGCSGEDFAAILRGLGYRAEQRPAAQHEAALAAARAKAESDAASRASEAAAAAAKAASASEPAPPEGEAAPVEAAAESGGEAGPDGMNAAATDAAVSDVGPAAEDVPTELINTGVPAVQGAGNAATVENAPSSVAEAEEPEAPAESRPDAPAGADAMMVEAPIESAGDGTAAPAAEAAAPEEPAAPATVEVWRPQRFDRRPQQHQRRSGERRNGGPAQNRGAAERHAGRRNVAAQPAGSPASADAVAPATPSPDGQPRRQQRPGGEGRVGRPPRGERGERSARPDRRDGEGRPPRPDGGERRPARFDRNEGRPSRPDRERDRTPRVFSSEPSQSRNNRPPDPDSPFAKLAALKAQMEQDKNR